MKGFYLFLILFIISQKLLATADHAVSKNGSIITNNDVHTYNFNSNYVILKPKQFFLIRWFRDSDLLLKCSTNVYGETTFEDGSSLIHEGDTIPKGKELSIDNVQITRPEDFKENKSISRHILKITATYKEDLSSIGRKEYKRLYITCERDFMASKKYRYLPIGFEEVEGAFHGDLTFQAN